MRLFIWLALGWLFSTPAFAGAGTITTKDAGGTTRTFVVVTDGSGNFNATAVVCDQSAAATCASVGTQGSPSTNALTVQAVTLGHGTAANAMRVELPTDGTGLVNAAQSGTWNITNITGTVSLPTGAATSANQSTEITALQAIQTNTSLGALVDESAYTEGSTSNIMIGGYFKSAPTVLTTGQSGGATLTADRKLIIAPYADASNFAVSGVITSAMTGTTSTSLIASPGAGLHNYITQCTFSNSHATQGTMMILQDGSGGTTIYSAPAAPAYGGASITFPTPLRQPTAATALFVQNVTTGANTFAACSGYKGT